MTDETAEIAGQRTVHSDFDQVRRDAAQPEGQSAAEQAGLTEAIRNATPDTPETRESAARSGDE